MHIMTFFEVVAQHSRDMPDQLAIVSETCHISFRQLQGQVEAAAAQLQLLQIRPESMVGISLDDEVDHLIVSLGIMALGANHVSLATFDDTKAREKLAERSGVTHIISRHRNYALGCAEFIHWHGIEPMAAPELGAGAFNSASKLLLKTSGTTGDINIVTFSEADIGKQARRHMEYSGERLLRLASIEHNNSKRHRLYCVWNGGTNAFRPKGEVDVVDFCVRHNVTCLDISRMHASDLVASASAAALGSIKIRTGGSAVPIDIRRSIEKNVTQQLYVRYAATECGAISMAKPGEHDNDEPVGCPLPGVKLEIIGPDGLVPRGESGSIRLRAPGMATSYLDNVSASKHRFRDGWFYPGDVGTLRSDGQLIVHGREDDMMILNGVNVYPVEIERVLERHPFVKVAVALPLASKIHGQIPVAALELRPETGISARELQSYARKHLGLRAPRRILIMEKLPRNSQGKLMKREVIEAFKPTASKT